MTDSEKPSRFNKRRLAWIATAVVALLVLLWYIQPGADASKHGGKFGASGTMPVVAAVAQIAMASLAAAAGLIAGTVPTTGIPGSNSARSAPRACTEPVLQANTSTSG